MVYKNLSNTKKIFHGVTFLPGESKKVDGYINHPSMLSVTDSDIEKSEEKKVESIKATKKTTSAKTAKEEVTSDGTDHD